MLILSSILDARITADGTRYSQGFKVSMEYDDGHGYGVCQVSLDK